ncbi:hypothetical protein [Synechococcus sp. MIT S9508]|uniref:hypothetical protein n=1 Tax=Synechococcus sp. MIT S9508 TaxID=1801629 RepID=UPI0012E8FA83|nr:hypothetical protein [Synechococcus sp. MIT S9508]
MPSTVTDPAQAPPQNPSNSKALKRKEPFISKLNNIQSSLAIMSPTKAARTDTEGAPQADLLRACKGKKKETRCRLPQSWCDLEVVNLPLIGSTKITSRYNK